MNHNSPNKILFIFLFVITCLTTNISFSQRNWNKTKLSDGVEKYYRLKSADSRPWFFKQLEEIFDVMLSQNNELPFGKSIAFLVGVSKYNYISPQLPFVENDLDDMRDFLLTTGGFDEVYVARGKIVNSTLVKKYIKQKFRSQLNTEDRLLFYYSGHGADSGGNTGYMQFSNAKRGEFYTNDVLEILAANTWCTELKIKHLLFIFDCCASGLAFTPKGTTGNGFQQMIATLSRNGSRVIMTAGTAKEKTFEVKGNGVFTRAFLNAVKYGKADKGKDGFITIDEINAHIKNEVASFAARYKQSLTPRLWPIDVGDYRGTFVFVNPRAKEQGAKLKTEYSKSLKATPRGKRIAAYGIIRLISYLSGKVYIDGQFVENIESGEAVDYYEQSVGSHTIKVRAAGQTVTKKVQVTKGKTSKVTISPPKTEPAVVKKEIKQPPKIDDYKKVTPRYNLRSRAKTLSYDDVKKMLTEKKLFDKYKNKTGAGINNDYESRTEFGEKVVIDQATGLMWQQSGSDNYMTYKEAEQFIKGLNKGAGFAGYKDWRLPTLEEAMSLMEPEENSKGLYIDEKFDSKQQWIWTSDKKSAGVVWVVDFVDGYCFDFIDFNYYFVRAVR